MSGRILFTLIAWGAWLITLIAAPMTGLLWLWAVEAAMVVGMTTGLWIGAREWKRS